MAVVFAAVTPHGWPLIPDLSADAAGALATREALREMGRRAAARRPEVVVIATPHNIRVAGAVCLAAVARGAGVLRHAGRAVEMNVPVDGPLTAAIAAAARERAIPVALAGYAGHLPTESAVPLDWGTMVPLWFLGHGRNLIGLGDVLAVPPAEDRGPPVVIVSPARDLPRASLMQFGEAVAAAAEADGRRVAFVASCDWAHAHPGSRYGESEAAAAVDAAVVRALQANDLDSLLALDERQVAAASIDGLWQALILVGVLRHRPFRGAVLSYEAPEAYATGMIVATFAPIREKSRAAAGRDPDARTDKPRRR